MFENIANIQKHADCDEEKTQENIAEGLDVFFNLIAIFGFGNQHPRQKSPQCHGEPCHLREPGEPKRDQKHVEHKKFAGFTLGHQRKPVPHEFLPKEQHQR